MPPPATNVDRLLADFETKFHHLKDFPDRAIILDLTAFCELHIEIAPHLADIIIARIIDPNTNLGYKLPIFYLIDAIMKHVGGPYPALFSRHLGEVFKRAFDELNNRDKDRLNNLLGTWEERLLLPRELLVQMRRSIGPPLAPAARGGPPPREAARIVPQVPPEVVAVPIIDPRDRDRERERVGGPIRSPPGGRVPGPGFVGGPRPSFDRGPPGPYQGGPRPDFRPGYERDPRDRDFRPDAGRLDRMDGRMERMDRMDRYPRGPMIDRRERSRERSHERSRERSRDRGMIPGPHYAGGYKRMREDIGPGPEWRGGPRPFGGPGMAGPGAAPPAFARLVDIEMRKLLDQMYIDMGVTGDMAIPLDRLAGVNPQLFEQLRGTAEANVRAFDRPGGRGPAGPIGGPIREPSPAASGVPGFARLPPQATKGLGPSPGAAPGPSVNAFVCETPVVVDINRAEALDVRLAEIASAVDAPDTDADVTSAAIGLKKASKILSERLNALLKTVNVPPSLPPILFGPLPLEPSKEYTAMRASSAAAAAKPVQKKQKPKFRHEDIGRRPDRAVRALYADQPFQYNEDGLRFKTLALLSAHTDKFLDKKEALRKGEGVRTFRQWYCTSSQWITNFSELGDGVSGSSSSAPGEGASSSGAAAASSQEEYIVAADEFFDRCPVSKEKFDMIWDDEEGSYMFRNAVRVLVTEAADAALFKLGQPTDEPGINYLIVHKPLVMDGWLQQGRAETLKGAIMRYEGMGRSAEKNQQLVAAAGDDDDDEDVFVILELLT